AATRPAEAIPVGEISDMAGVSRQTFYRRWGSPVQCLSEVLGQQHLDLGRILSEALADPTLEFATVWREAYLRTLRHVDQYIEVYKTMIVSHSSVFLALTDILIRAAGDVIEDTIGTFVENEVGAIWSSVAAQQQAGNVTALIRLWALPEERPDPEQLVDTLMIVAPPWQLARRTPEGWLNIEQLVSRRHDRLDG
ncbi:MAG: hypothetical protein ACTH1Z_05670, partial [Ancrocorticia sp.]